jgi:hypothetical protein
MEQIENWMIANSAFDVSGGKLKSFESFIRDVGFQFLVLRVFLMAGNMLEIRFEFRGKI